jgi:hypothetical protein
MKPNFKTRASVLAFLGLSALVLAGCGGGNSNNSSQNQTLPAANLVALSSNNVLSFFDARTPGTATSRTVSGLASGEQLIGIDYRFAPIAAATTGTGLFGLARTGTSGVARLVRIDLSGIGAVATSVGAGFTLPFTGSNIGFDFNPVVDRIRVVDATSRANLRINPDTGALVDGDANTAGTQSDTAVAYDAGDSGNGTTPRLVGAAYTNNVTGTTSTINYAIDAARGTLVTQGRPANATVPNDVAVSPNTGRLFTVGTLGSAVSTTNGAGFDIAPGTNNAFVATASSGSSRLFAVNLSTAATTGGANISLRGNRPLLGLAILP